MDVKDLRFFIAVYETGGFSSAAAVLGTVQSNVSSRIGKLERGLGVSLFHRECRRRVVPTTFAEKLYPRAKQLVEGMETAKRAMRRAA